jgi:hypothetical protein
MSVIEMAKAHVQNVLQRTEELAKQQKLLQNEIDQLKVYADKCVSEIQAFENENSKEGEKR